MANEVTTSAANDLVFASWIMNEHILDFFYPLNLAGHTVRFASLAGIPSNTHDFPKSPQLTAASLVEGTDLTNTAFTTTKSSVTATENGLMLTITDRLSVSDVADDSYYAQEAAKALAQKVTTDITALATGFSATAGATTVNLTEANILTATTTLMANSAPGPYQGILHPQQWFDLAGDIGTTITPAGAGGEPARAATQDFGAKPDGGLGNLYGVDWTVSAAVPTATAGADRAGMVVSPNFAIGFAEKWAARTEFERDASLRGMEIVVTGNYGVAELKDEAGVTILSDA